MQSCQLWWSLVTNQQQKWPMTVKQSSDLLLKQQSGSSQAAACAGISFFSISKMDFYFKSLLLYQQDEGKLFFKSSQI